LAYFCVVDSAVAEEGGWVCACEACLHTSEAAADEAEEGS
jgi:hypothetical protein